MKPLDQWKQNPLNLDAGDNQDWTKQSWDLPPYKSEEFYELVPKDELDHFRALPVYRWAVRKGLIKDDEWVGEKWRMKAERLPNGNMLIPKRAEEPDGVIGDGVIEVTSDDSEFKLWDEFLRREAEEEMKYFAKIENGRAMIVARTYKTTFQIHERWDWREKKWVDGTEVFREMSGVGGDGYDWKEVTKEEAYELIKSRRV